MALATDYKKNKRITIGFNDIQMNSLKTLESYGINISQFIRLAVKEKIKRDWKSIKEKKNKEYCPY